MTTILGWILAVALLSPVVSAGDWPYWRGPGRNDVVKEDSGWSRGVWPPRLLWSKSFGQGTSSPIIAGGKLYGFGHAGGRDSLTCVDAASGKEIWRQSYACPIYGRHSAGDKGFYAGPCSTPELDMGTGLLYTLSIDGRLHCWNVNAGGKQVWGFNLYDKYRPPMRPRVGRSGRRDYGYTSSPLVQGDALVVEVGDDEGTLMGFDKRTGQRLWASEVKDPAGHNGGPVPITVEGVPCVAVLNHEGLLVVRLDKGREGKTVAQYPWKTSFANNIATPAVHENTVILTSGYNQYAVCKLKITLRGAEKQWQTSEVCSKVCSPIIHGGRVYWVWRDLHCLDFNTGKLLWQVRGRFSDPGSCLMTSDEKLIAWTNRGRLLLVDAAEKPAKSDRVLADINGVANSDAWPHVVLSGGRLYCKDKRGGLKCFALERRSDTPKPVASAKKPPVIDLKSLKTWPGETPGLLLAWRRGLGEKIVGPDSSMDKWRLQRHGAARIGADGRLNMAGGHCVLQGGEEALLNACRRSGRFSLEVKLTSENARQTGPARIVTFSSSPYSRNFTFCQERDRFILRLRTPRTGENGMRPESVLCRATPGKPQHLILSYQDGRLSCFLDGREVVSSTKVTGDLSNWSAQHLLLGGEWKSARNWSGTLDRVAIYSRCISRQEAQRRFELSRD